jgi:hypothetical protein
MAVFPAHGFRAENFQEKGIDRAGSGEYRVKKEDEGRIDAKELREFRLA